MPLTDDRPTVAERYSRASQSSDLKLREGRCDVDMLIAAGWVPGTLGSLLHRLKGEFDRVKAELSGEAGNAETERLLVLMQLKSLAETRDRLAEWGTNRATFKGYKVAESDVPKLIGRTLDVWLSPLCDPCGGRGFTGGGRHENSGPRIRCAACGETGRRKQRLGKDEAEREFAGDLMAHMDRMCQEVEAHMGRFLKG
jgi:hypothetical protein